MRSIESFPHAHVHQQAEPSGADETRLERLRERIQTEARDRGLSHGDRDRLERALHRFHERGPVDASRREQFLAHVKSFIDRHAAAPPSLPEPDQDVTPNVLDLVV